MSLTFKVEGSQGDLYVVTAEIGPDKNLTILCTCPAGQNGLYCRHRFALLDGDDSMLLSNNAGDIHLLRDMARGTDVDVTWAKVRKLQAEADGVNARLRGAKKALARAMHD